jgi:hypothetical protein
MVLAVNLALSCLLKTSSPGYLKFIDKDEIVTVAEFAVKPSVYD